MLSVTISWHLIATFGQLVKTNINSVLVNGSISIDTPIKQNKLPLFSTPPCKLARNASQLSMLRSNLSLFSRLYITAQHRGGDLKDFFSRENQRSPPSISYNDNIRLGTKSDLLDCIDFYGASSCELPSEFDCSIFDGPVLLHTLSSSVAVVFDDYATRVFIPFFERELKRSSRVDVVWDVYLPESLKESTQEKRGKGTRRKVSEQTKMPRDFAKFLLDCDNKQEFMNFLSAKTASYLRCQPGQRVFITKNSDVISIGSDRQMTPCDHEEADSRIIVHLKDALQESQNINVQIRTVDTDVAVILIGKWLSLSSLDSRLWLTLGSGKHVTCRSTGEICSALGKDKCKSLPMFHAFTGCDTVSAFFGKGKKSWWEAWKSFPSLSLYCRTPFYSLWYWYGFFLLCTD
eukprot:Pompholyxophrys_sp_v1_NODE_11_length_5290_cov_18.520778.p1 type:complete len:404 gc:universal NODE_11_length_5290_cov_18.520778:3057-4268(+)